MINIVIDYSGETLTPLLQGLGRDLERAAGRHMGSSRVEADQLCVIAPHL